MYGKRQDTCISCSKTSDNVHFIFTLNVPSVKKPIRYEITIT